MSRLLFLLIVLAVLPRAASAQTVMSPGADNVAVTIYRAPDRGDGQRMNLGWLQGYALITERRTIDIPAGRATIRFEGVAAGMLPESAIVTGLPSSVREKNLDAELLSPRNLFARAFGRPIMLRRTNPIDGGIIEEPAIIRSSPDGAAILQTRDGFEAINCGPLREALVYQSVPEGLSAKPTLSVQTDAATAMRVTVSLSYLAWGFDWQANYVATLRSGGRTADLMAWVTLASGDSTSFPDAETAVVGGQVNREGQRRYEWRGDNSLVFRCPLRGPLAGPAVPLEAMADGDVIVTGSRVAMAAPAPPPPPPPPPVTVAEEGLGDLKLYRVPMPTTVAANSQKQVTLLVKPSVPVDIVYTANLFPGSKSPGQPAITLRVMNRKDKGLGVSLPSGQLALFEMQGERRLLVGEGRVADKTVGEEVEVNIAAATQVTLSAVSPGADGDRWQLTLRNANPWPIRFEGTFIAHEGETITNLSRKLDRKNGRPLWKVTVPANGTATLSYVYRQGDD